MKLVDDAKDCWRWLSVHFSAIISVLPIAWLELPEDWKAAVPHWAVLIFTVLGLSAIVGRLIDQKKA